MVLRLDSSPPVAYKWMSASVRPSIVNAVSAISHSAAYCTAFACVALADSAAVFMKPRGRGGRQQRGVSEIVLGFDLGRF